MSDNQLTRPSFRNFSSRLAANNQRVGFVVEGIFEYVEALDDAVNRSDWREVRRMAELIFVDSLTYGFPEMADAADRIAQASTASVCLTDIEKPLENLKRASAAESASNLGIRPPRRRRGSGPT